MTMMYATLGLVADSRDFHKSSPEYVRTVLLCFRSLKVVMAYSILQNMAECVLTVRFLPTEPRNFLQGLKCGQVFLRSICLF